MMDFLKNNSHSVDLSWSLLSNIIQYCMVAKKLFVVSVIICK